MSVDVVPVKSKHFFGELYYAEWKITNLLSYKKKKLTTPPFCPLSNFDVKFYFEIWFLEYRSDQITKTLFKIVLIKLEGTTVPASLKLELEMKVEYSDGTLMNEFHGLPIVTVKEMDNYYFDEIHSIFKYHNGFSEHGLKLNNDNSILLKCNMKFFDHLVESPGNNLPPKVLYSFKLPGTASGDVASFKRSDEFCDILMRVGAKLFLAHKTVLANHSPVIKQMISQKSEDETALELDSDLCDVFDSFLDYLYSADFEYSSWSKLRDLYVLSSKYEVDALKKKCSDAIMSHLSVDKVSEILKVACEFEDLSLKEPAVKFAVEHIRDIISSKEWKELVTSYPLIAYEVTANALNI